MQKTPPSVPACGARKLRDALPGHRAGATFQPRVASFPNQKWNPSRRLRLERAILSSEKSATCISMDYEPVKAEIRPHRSAFLIDTLLTAAVSARPASAPRQASES